MTCFLNLGNSGGAKMHGKYVALRMNNPLFETAYSSTIN